MNIMDHLTLREQVKLLELAAEASNFEVREHAIAILNQYRSPPRMVALCTVAEGDRESDATGKAGA